MSQTHVDPDGGSTTGTPGWVKVFGIIVIVLVLLFVVVQFTGRGSHGPGRHIPSGDTPPSSITEDHTPSDGLGGHPPREGGHG